MIYANGGGEGLIEAHFKNAERLGIDVRYGARGVALLRGAHGVEGVRAEVNGVPEDIRAKAVVLASGGFEANREWRARYLGPGWDMAKVRGTRYNTGDGIRMALDIGAQPYGQWSGCHSCAWERNAGDFGSVETRHNGFRHSYLFGIVVNADGKRFLDEGADFRNFTYAKYGRVILQQPGGYAWQVFDAQAKPLMRDEYKLRGATKVTADTLEDLVTRMQDVDAAQFLKTVREFNAAITRDVPFNPNVKDGRRTVGLEVDKTNWATALETAAVRGLFGRLRHHLHVRRREDRHHRARARHRGCAAARPLCGGRTGRRHFLFQLSRRDRTDVIGGVRPTRRTGRGGTRESSNAPPPFFIIASIARRGLDLIEPVEAHLLGDAVRHHDQPAVLVIAGDVLVVGERRNVDVVAALPANRPSARPPIPTGTLRGSPTSGPSAGRSRSLRPRR